MKKLTAGQASLSRLTETLGLLLELESEPLTSSRLTRLIELTAMTMLSLSNDPVGSLAEGSTPGPDGPLAGPQ